MKRLWICLGCLLLLLISGCANEGKQEVTRSSSRTVVSEELNSASTTSTKEDPNLWNKDKEAKLADFMKSWGKSMGQKYEAYTPQKPVNYYGLKMPEDLLKQVNGLGFGYMKKKEDLTWSDNGIAKTDFALVAVYSDALTQHYMEQHVYFFTYYKGKPKVLLTMQNEGSPDQLLHFQETDNQALRTGFAKICQD